MTKNNNVKFYRSKGMLPYQAEAAINILASKDKPYWQLISPVGTGKTIVAAVIASEIMKETRNRILVLAPAALLDQWYYEILYWFSVKWTKPLYT